MPGIQALYNIDIKILRYGKKQLLGLIMFNVFSKNFDARIKSYFTISFKIIESWPL